MKRLNTRIDALEKQTRTNGLTRAESELLVSVLARRDALFWPWRITHAVRPEMCELRTRQKEYLAGQVGVAVRADGKADWKNAHELRQRLITAGLITATHSSGQITSCFLTPQGEAVARALVGDRLWTFQRARLLWAILQIRSQETSVRAVRESGLFGIEGVGCPNDWDDYNEMILPLLTCGIVTASSDTEGRACYTPVEGIPEPVEVVVNVVADDAFDSLYLKAFADERAMLERVEPRDPHEVHIPLPATGWGWPCYFPEDEAK